MATLVTCDCNAGMERVFYVKTPDNQPDDLSNDSRYSIYFEMVNPLQSTEERYLKVTQKNSPAAVLLRVRLRDDIAVKPSNGVTAIYKPHERPFLKGYVTCDIENERVFYAKTNLSADAGVEVKFDFEPSGDDSDDAARYLSFTITSAPHVLDDGDIDLGDDGGKKPLGAGWR